DLLFVDLDVLAIGPVVADVSRDFDRYWSSASSYPAGKVLPPIDSASIAELAGAAADVEHAPEAIAYMQALAESPFVRSLLAHDLRFEWAPVHMVSDDPAKGLGQAPDDELMWPRLKRVMKKPTRELDLVSPYFVPGADGVQALDEMARSGVAVTVLTNSLAATDVAAVHAGYAKRRKALLEAGVALFEMKPGSRTPAADAPRAPPGNRGRVGSSGNGGSSAGIGSSGVGSSASSLHAKTFSVDDAQIFIGSFNFDPRSARLNTEMGFVIDSPTLAQSISDTFARRMPERAYEVRLAPDGSLRWVEHAGGAEIVHDQEPGTTFWKRLGVSLMSLLPIDWLL
ncbi:MAG: phospholipase D-like domain-containing protein, partial [Caldimonas sp.]